MDELTQLQPLSSKKALQDIEKQVQRALETGARLVTGGKIIP
jgi:succinate-semialdehyde dehydrogenase/glutarate-semialdehyde dehydrogenase